MIYNKNNCSSCVSIKRLCSFIITMLLVAFFLGAPVTTQGADMIVERDVDIVMRDRIA